MGRGSGTTSSSTSAIAGRRSANFNQLNRDIATGNTWGVLRDVNNIQQDRRDLYQDRQNLQADLQYQTQPYPSIYGGYPQDPCPPRANPYRGSPYPYGGGAFGNVSPYGFGGAVGPYPVARPW